MYEFEFDKDKSRANKEKHGIDFDEGQIMWQDPDLLEVRAKTVDESRFLEIGKIGNIYWTAVITYRGPKIRIISMRPSRKNERELYEGN